MSLWNEKTFTLDSRPGVVKRVASWISVKAELMKGRGCMSQVITQVNTSSWPSDFPTKKINSEDDGQMIAAGKHSSIILHHPFLGGCHQGTWAPVQGCLASPRRPQEVLAYLEKDWVLAISCKLSSTLVPYVAQQTGWRNMTLAQMLGQMTERHWEQVAANLQQLLASSPRQSGNLPS